MMSDNNNNNNNGRRRPQQQQQVVMSEIEEEMSSSSDDDLFEINGGGGETTDGSLFSYDIHHHAAGKEDDIVYVAVLQGKNAEDSSKDALTWTLNRSSTAAAAVVYLIHIFPELHYIPTPLGKLPISQVNREQKNNHMVQERRKRSEFLQKFLDLCAAYKVKVETIVIESDMEAKAIVDLIPILNIKTLVVGTTKSSLRRLKAGRGSGVAEQIKKSAPDFCQVKLICEGVQVSDQLDDDDFNILGSAAGTDEYHHRPDPLPINNSNNSIIISTSTSRSQPHQNQQQRHDEVEIEDNQIIKDNNQLPAAADSSFTCSCFKPKAIS